MDKKFYDQERLVERCETEFNELFLKILSEEFPDLENPPPHAIEDAAFTLLVVAIKMHRYVDRGDKKLLRALRGATKIVDMELSKYFKKEK